jgi:hypothetical protein
LAETDTAALELDGRIKNLAVVNSRSGKRRKVFFYQVARRLQYFYSRAKKMFLISKEEGVLGAQQYPHADKPTHNHTAIYFISDHPSARYAFEATVKGTSTSFCVSGVRLQTRGNRSIRHE